MPWKHCTNRGRVVYERAPTPFRPSDIRRISRKMAVAAAREPFFGTFSDILALVESIGFLFSLIGSITVWENVPFIGRARAAFIIQMMEWMRIEPEVDLELETELIPSHDSSIGR